MEKSKIDKFVDAFRTAMYHEFSVSEEGMVANPPGDLVDLVAPPLTVGLLLATIPT